VYVGGIQPNGPAARTGLAEGDVIITAGGTPVKTDLELRNTIAMIKPGTTVDLEVIHQDGHKSIVKVKLGELPDQAPQQQQQPVHIRRH
jgi:S1-C subfamily serine protease